MPQHLGFDAWHLDVQVQALLAASEGTPPIHSSGADAARARVAAMRTQLPPPPLVESVEDLEVIANGVAIPIRVYRPTSTIKSGYIVYFHGGGWVLGGIEESDTLCRALALASGHCVVSVGYRLAPENAFPAAVDDADAVVLWLTSSYRPGESVVVVGDSAGGNLAAVVTRRFRDRGSSSIVLQVLVYPVTDARMAGDSYVRYDDSGLLLGARDMAWFWDQYAPVESDRSAPDASPLLVEDLTGLPPAMVIVAEVDVLRDEGIAYSTRLAGAGVDVTLDRYETMIHGFFPLVGLLDVATAAVESVAEACARSLALP